VQRIDVAVGEALSSSEIEVLRPMQVETSGKVFGSGVIGTTSRVAQNLAP
jgi:hypothetical protein